MLARSTSDPDANPDSLPLPDSAPGPSPNFMQKLWFELPAVELFRYVRAGEKGVAEQLGPVFEELSRRIATDPRSDPVSAKESG